MLRNKIGIKVGTLFVLIFQILFSNGTLVFAYDSVPGGNFSDGSGSIDIPEPMSVGDDILNKYNISQDSLIDMAQDFNASTNKINTPEVTLTFSPSEPKEGETITASALPMYFSNPDGEHYFTWYLVHKDCDELGNNPSKAAKELCDADGNGKIEVNDWKVEAMRLIATQGYDNQDEPKPDYGKDGDNDEYKAYFGGGDKGGQGDSTGGDTMYNFSDKHCYIYNANDGIAHELPECKHLFPSTNGNGKVGDGEFGHQEEKFWGTNPQDPNTAGNGNMDEANISGRGQSTFSWNYQAGDRVGVAVEGTSILATKYENSSYMTMWAFPKNKFVIDQKGSKVYCQKASNATDHPPCADGYFNVSIPTACNTMTNDCGEDKMNETFKDNLVNPAEKTNEKLDISLSYAPDNPINDTSGDNLGDLLYVNSSIANPTQDPSQIRYEWKISAGTSIADASFKDISQKLNEEGMLDGKLVGINNPKIGIGLNLESDDYAKYFKDKDGVGYLKIRVIAKESIPGKIRIGKGETIVRINATGNRIKAYLTSSMDGSSLSRGDIICNGAESSSTASTEDRLALYICPVVKNQILRLEVDKDGMSDFSWSVDGKSIICDNSLSSDCSDGNVVFLPILGAEGDNIDVRMNAKNISKNNNANDADNGKSIELSKKFQIVKPYIKIVSNDVDTFWPILLGSYSDLNGNQYPDYSDSRFETYTDESVSASLTAEFHPTWLQKIEILNSKWELDGEDRTDDITPEVLNFSLAKSIGEVYNAKFSSFHAPSNEVRKVLRDYWGVDPSKSDGGMIDSAISGEVISTDAAGTLSFKSPSKFLASIIANLSSQTLFLLRTVLIIFMVILISGLAMNFSPSFGKNKQ